MTDVPVHPQPGRRRWLGAVIVIASLITLVPMPAEPNHTTTRRAATLEALDPERPPITTTSAADPCVRRLRWRHTFPTPYLGEVYALISASQVATTPVVVTMMWGRWRWQATVPAAPGMVQFRRGGTLLLFAKTGGTTGRNPGLVVEATVPICVQFGTAAEGPVQPAVRFDANLGWAFRHEPYT